MKKWKLEIDSWPGPDRRKWRGLQDVIEESPDGRHVGVVYSCGEIGIGKDVGLFALLKEPADSPELLIRPRGLTCFFWYNGNTVQWIDERFCAVTPHIVRQSLLGKSKIYSGALFFDVREKKFAYIPGTSTSEKISRLPNDLNWKNWRVLSWYPSIWRALAVKG